MPFIYILLGVMVGLYVAWQVFVFYWNHSSQFVNNYYLDEDEISDYTTNNEERK